MKMKAETEDGDGCIIYSYATRFIPFNTWAVMKPEP